jgi:hypothetical protein
MEEKAIGIKIDDLEKITKLLLEQLRQSTGEVIEFDVDYFWHVTHEERYDPYTDPKNLTLGQVSDDLTELGRLLKRKDETIYYDFERLANILAAISYELARKNTTL